MEIAVLVQADGNTSGFERDGTIMMYLKKNDSWSIQRSMVYNTADLMDAAALHMKIREICEWLDTCKVIVVNRIRGIHYIAFEEYQISMLEIKGNPSGFLDHIQECDRHQRAAASSVPMEHKAIFEGKPGNFYADLRDVMNGRTSYNSKQILLPFIKNRGFQVLEIICDHVPKWLEREQAELKVIVKEEPFKDCIKVNIYPC